MKNNIQPLKTKTALMYLLVAIPFAFLLNSCSSDDDISEPPVDNSEFISTSQFLTDAQGWKITGDAQGGYIEASYSPDGGVSNGYIYADDDVAGGVWYFTAPTSYHGNKNAYYGASLKFSLFQDSAMNNQFESSDIIFRNGVEQITYVHNTADYPTINWTNYTIKISTGNGWLKGEYDSGIEATEADIKAILSNVTEFSIRGEFQSGPDNGGLDNVKILVE